MPESRRSLHLMFATLAALLGLQLASCADVETEPDQAPPGVVSPNPVTRPSAPVAPPVAAPDVPADVLKAAERAAGPELILNPEPSSTPQVLEPGK